ncbi:MAG: CpsD/CapB family tyrosine-protein kinase [Pseudomonadota bacterium]
MKAMSDTQGNKADSHGPSPTSDDKRPPVIFLQDESKARSEKANSSRRVSDGSGEMQTAKLGHHRIDFNKADSAAATALKVLRTQVFRRMRQHNWQTLAITSSNPGEGKTFTAVNLALSFAQKPNFPVLLVDLDLRRPTLHHYFDHRSKASVEQAVTEGLCIEKVWFRPDQDSELYVIPALNPIASSSEILSSLEMAKLVKQFRVLFEKGIVVFDLPPLLHTDDVLAFSPLIDSLLLVVEESNTRWRDLKLALELLEDIEVIGTVLNRSKTASRYYY